MTLEEKIAQLGSVWMGASGDGDGVAPMQDQFFSHDAAAARRADQARARPAHPGVRHPPGRRRRRACARWPRCRRGSMAASRFGIPAVAHEECLTGFAAWGATIFPTPLAWGASFDPALVREMAAAFGATMRAVGVHQGLAPVLDVTRDSRWGRIEETIGEDPYLVGDHRHRVRAAGCSGRRAGHAQALRRATPRPAPGATWPRSPWGRASSPTSSCRRSRWPSGSAAPAR